MWVFADYRKNQGRICVQNELKSSIISDLDISWTWKQYIQNTSSVLIVALSKLKPYTCLFSCKLDQTFNCFLMALFSEVFEIQHDFCISDIILPPNIMLSVATELIRCLRKKFRELMEEINIVFNFVEYTFGGIVRKIGLFLLLVKRELLISYNDVHIWQSNL